ncbi:hypothetical protein PoB_002096200 [Plakobranchus ocellatus]|uniref:Uncharacterized protein n=1 Tax=Plakobranchus ocellatus TaxID=259542 RepID=A0AAV3ZGL7_9GAST|nr:hypothetical protein PoB_002096200 [Plakobranchus ocellatus]
MIITCRRKYLSSCYDNPGRKKYFKRAAAKFQLLRMIKYGNQRKPAPQMINYRFLSNHISLLEADADHIRKKLEWKDADLKTLQADLVALKSKDRPYTRLTTSPTQDVHSLG